MLKVQNPPPPPTSTVVNEVGRPMKSGMFPTRATCSVPSGRRITARTVVPRVESDEGTCDGSKVAPWPSIVAPPTGR